VYNHPYSGDIMKLSVKNLVSLADLTKKDFNLIFSLSKKLKSMQKAGKQHHLLKGKTLAMLFEKPSTRTRVSFETGTTQLGGHAIFLGKNDIQLGRGETIADTAKTLSGYVDIIMARTFEHSTVTDLAKHATIPVINGLTNFNHPCQILADLFTVIEKKKSLKELKFAWIGDGNNVCHSFINASNKLDFSLSVATPKNYKPKLKCNWSTQPTKAIKNADVVITDSWTSMGDKNKKKRIRDFKGFTINKKLTKLAKKNFIFLHCLPAYRGYEVSPEIIDGTHSLIWQEAENRMHTQKAIMTALC
jgi:ornithine carbamoyltransferase